MRTGRSASARSRPIRSTASPSGSAPRGRDPSGSTAEAWLKNSSIGTSTKTGPRCEEPASRKASSKPVVTPSAVGIVRALLVIEATIGGWSSSWRLPLPQRFCGARPPTTTMGDPANCAWAMALMPFVTPGPAVSTASPGTRVSFPVASAANAAVCSWRTSRIRIGGSAFTAPSYIGKTWAPDSVNRVSTPCARATATARSPAWPLRSVPVSESLMRRTLPTGHLRPDGGETGITRAGGTPRWSAGARRPARAGGRRVRRSARARRRPGCAAPAGRPPGSPSSGRGRGRGRRWRSRRP